MVLLIVILRFHRIVGSRSINIKQATFIAFTLKTTKMNSSNLKYYNIDVLISKVNIPFRITNAIRNAD